MGATIKSVYRVDNGVDFDIYHYETETSQVKTNNGSTVDVELELAKQHSIYTQGLINSNYDIWQRGVSFTQNVGAGGSSIYTADRWFIATDGTTNATHSRQAFTVGQTAVPNSPDFYHRTVVTSQSGATYMTLNQAIEGVEKFSGMNATVTFWAKADASRTLQVNFKQKFGTGGSPSTDVQLTIQNASLTTSWQKFTFTFAIPSISGKTLGTNGNDCLYLWFGMPLNTAQTIDIAQVQVNAGTVALPYSPKSNFEEYMDCRKYYQLLCVTAYATTTSTVILTNPTLTLPMRTAPTITKFGNNATWDNSLMWDNISNANTATLSVSSANKDYYVVWALTMTGTPFTVGHYYTTTLWLDAEL